MADERWYRGEGRFLNSPIGRPGRLIIMLRLFTAASCRRSAFTGSSLPPDGWSSHGSFRTEDGTGPRPKEISPRVIRFLTRCNYSSSRRTHHGSCSFRRTGVDIEMSAHSPHRRGNIFAEREERRREDGGGDVFCIIAPRTTLCGRQIASVHIEVSSTTGAR